MSKPADIDAGGNNFDSRGHVALAEQGGNAAAGRDDGVAQVGIARSEGADEAGGGRRLDSRVMRVLVPHGVMGENEGDFAGAGHAESRIAHEKGVMGVDDVGPKIVHGGGHQTRRGDRERKIAAVEMLEGGYADDVGTIIAMVVGLRSDD